MIHTVFSSTRICLPICSSICLSHVEQSVFLDDAAARRVDVLQYSHRKLFLILHHHLKSNQIKSILKSRSNQINFKEWIKIKNDGWRNGWRDETNKIFRISDILQIIPSTSKYRQLPLLLTFAQSILSNAGPIDLSLNFQTPND